MIFDKALRKASRRAVQAPQGAVLTLENADGWPGWTGEDAVALSRDKAMKLSIVSRCVELRANAVAMLPVYLMDETSKTRPRDHPLGDLLWGNPNEAMNNCDYQRLMQCNLDLRGNAYAWIVRSGRTGRPEELIPLRPDSVTPFVDAAGALWYVYTDPRTGALTRLAPEDVLHYKAYSTDGITGISILRRASLAITTGLSAQQYQSDLYANGGRPSGVLKTNSDLGGSMEVKNAKGETEIISKKEEIRRAWEKVHNGPGKRFRIAVLDHGLEYQPTALSNADAQLVESEELRVADIARFFAVPLHYLEAGKQSYASNEANAIEFAKFTILPLVVQREQEDTWKLLLPRERAQGLRIKRELKQLLRGDTAAQAAWYKSMRETGVYSVNDIRALEDIEAVDGGDIRYGHQYPSAGIGDAQGNQALAGPTGGGGWGTLPIFTPYELDPHKNEYVIGRTVDI